MRDIGTAIVRRGLTLVALVSLTAPCRAQVSARSNAWVDWGSLHVAEGPVINGAVVPTFPVSPRPFLNQTYSEATWNGVFDADDKESSGPPFQPIVSFMGIGGARATGQVQDTWYQATATVAGPSSPAGQWSGNAYADAEKKFELTFHHPRVIDWGVFLEVDVAYSIELLTHAPGDYASGGVDFLLDFTPPDTFPTATYTLASFRAASDDLWVPPGGGYHLTWFGTFPTPTGLDLTQTYACSLRVEVTSTAGAVPEPGSFVLMFTGLAVGVFPSCRRRR